VETFCITVSSFLLVIIVFVDHKKLLIGQLDSLLVIIVFVDHKILLIGQLARLLACRNFES
jgi:hypothetical protein